MKILKNFIVIEGLDGSGTTTQARLLRERLLEDGESIVNTQEPSNSMIGTLISAILEGKEKVNPKTLAYLFAADRKNHIDLLMDSFETSKVICDRYLFSSLAYQSQE